MLAMAATRPTAFENVISSPVNHSENEAANNEHPIDRDDHACRAQFKGSEQGRDCDGQSNARSQRPRPSGRG